MEGKTFIEWLNFIRKPTEIELWVMEMKRMRLCEGDCGQMIDGCYVNGLCTPCFNKHVEQTYKPMIRYV